MSLTLLLQFMIKVSPGRAPPLLVNEFISHIGECDFFSPENFNIRALEVRYALIINCPSGYCRILLIYSSVFTLLLYWIKRLYLSATSIGNGKRLILVPKLLSHVQTFRYTNPKVRPRKNKLITI